MDMTPAGLRALLPRERINTRLKDLVDMALMAELLEAQAPEALKAALALTFEFRDTHGVPVALPPASAELVGQLAKAESLPWTNLNQVFVVVQALTDPILPKAEP